MNPPPIPPPVITPDPKRRTYELMAKASWLLPVIAFASQFLLGRLPSTRAGFLFLALVQLALVLGGAVCAVIALTGTRRFGRQKMFGPAIAGLSIFLFLLLAIAALYPAYRMAKSRARQSSEQSR